MVLPPESWRDSFTRGRHFKIPYLKGQAMLFFLTKVVISGFIVALASWLAGKKAILAGFIVALPLISILSLFFAYIEHKDMTKINEFAWSIVVAVPLSMVFFVPFLMNKWLKWNFYVTFFSGLGLLSVAFLLHQLILRSG